MIKFDPVLIEELRQTLGLEDQRAAEHIWYAMQALETAGTEVVLKSGDGLAQPTSADITMQILKAKYNK